MPQGSNPELKKLKQEWKNRLDELHILFSLAKEICFTRSVDLLLEQLVMRAAEVIKSEGVSLFLMNPETWLLDFAIVKGQNSNALRNLDIHLRPGEGVAGWVAAHKESVIVNSPKDDPRFKADVDWMTGFQTRNLMAMPLMARGKILGVIELINRLDQDGFTDEDAEFLNSIAWLATMALDNAQNFQSLEKSEDYMNNILNGLSGGFVGVDMRNRITHFNARGMEILGLTKDVIGVRYTTALAGQESMIQAIEAAFVSGQGVKRHSFTINVPGKGGRRIGYSTLIIRDKRNVHQGVGVQFQDITDVQPD